MGILALRTVRQTAMQTDRQLLDYSKLLAAIPVLLSESAPTAPPFSYWPHIPTSRLATLQRDYSVSVCLSVTVEPKVACYLSNYAISNDLEWLLPRFLTRSRLWSIECCRFQ